MDRFPTILRRSSGQRLEIDDTRVRLALKRKRSPERVEAFTRKTGFILEASARPPVPDELRPNPVNDTDRSFFLKQSVGAAITDEAVSALESGFGDSLDYVAPVYRVAGTEGEGGLVSPLPRVLLVKPKTGIDDAQLESLLGYLANSGLIEDESKSRYLGGYRYFRRESADGPTVFDLRDSLTSDFRRLVEDVELEVVPLVQPVALVPNDTFFSLQWNMVRIGAPLAWDVSVGESEIVVGVLDSGCDLTHPDITYASNGVNLGTMSGTGAPVGPASVRPHGTCCAGIVAASINNARGVAGAAGGCRILPIAFQNWSDVEVAAGIRYGAERADVISMSFGHYGPGEGMAPAGWSFSLIDGAISDAVAADVVLVAATGNEDINTFNRYPARSGAVMAVGGSSTDDNRKTTTSPDGECWGANFANGVSVVAPCVVIPTTDIQGGAGYNDNNGGGQTQVCVTYASSGDAAGDYFALFNGTSAATPHVAGLAAQIRSSNPLFDRMDVQNVIEETAARVGTAAYSIQPGFPNGSRNQPMGYGRIDAGLAAETAGFMFVEQFTQLY